MTQIAYLLHFTSFYVLNNILRNQRKWSDNQASKAEAAAETQRPRDLYSVVRQLKSTGFKTIKPLKDEDGKLTTCKDTQNYIWDHYYKNLLSAQSLQPSCRSTAKTTLQDLTFPPHIQMVARYSKRNINRWKMLGFCYLKTFGTREKYHLSLKMQLLLLFQRRVT